MDYSDKIFVLYNKISKQIIFIQEPLKLKITPEQFLDERYFLENRCKDEPKENFGVIVSDRNDYRDVLKNINCYYFRIDEDKCDIEYVLKKQVVSNPTYNTQSIKRIFTTEQILEMYHEDYINYTLKNLLSTGFVTAKFLPLKDIHIRLSMLSKNWNYFYNDQFLTDSHEDKRLLGRDIYENGTYWPIIVSPSYDGNPEHMYCFEGTHRIISLKLNQMEGLVPDDYKIMCLCYNENYEVITNSKKFIPLSKPYRARSVLEVLYGNQVLTDEDRYKEAIDTCIEDNGAIKNEYTVEWNVKSIGDSIFATQTYPHWLRDLIYPVKDIVKPSPILNDELLFQRWLNG